jgi:hypothetical protein
LVESRNCGDRDLSKQLPLTRRQKIKVYAFIPQKLDLFTQANKVTEDDLLTSNEKELLLRERALCWCASRVIWEHMSRERSCLSHLPLFTMVMNVTSEFEEEESKVAYGSCE